VGEKVVHFGEIILIALEVVVGRRFDEHLSREVRDGTKTSFWWDSWLDGETLKSKFIRLFFFILLIMK